MNFVYIHMLKTTNKNAMLKQAKEICETLFAALVYSFRIIRQFITPYGRGYLRVKTVFFVRAMPLLAG